MLDLSTQPPSVMRPGEVSPYMYHRLGLHPPSPPHVHRRPPPQTMVSSGTGPQASHSESLFPTTFVPFRLPPQNPLVSRLSNLSLATPTIWATARDTLLDIPSPASTLTPTPPSTPTLSPIHSPRSPTTFELGSSLSLRNNDSTSSLITQ